MAFLNLLCFTFLLIWNCSSYRRCYYCSPIDFQTNALFLNWNHNLCSNHQFLCFICFHLDEVNKTLSINFLVFHLFMINQISIDCNLLVVNLSTVVIFCSYIFYLIIYYLKLFVKEFDYSYLKLCSDFFVFAIFMELMKL